MNKCLICPAWGLGDWIIVNPIVRILSKRYNYVGLVFNDYCKKFLKYMFSDISNIHFEYNCQNKLPNVTEITQYCKTNSIDLINLLTPGSFDNNGNYIVDTTTLNEPFNHYIYTKSGFNWERDVSQYHIPIDDDESYNLFKSFNLPDKYVFLHNGHYPKININLIKDKSAFIFIPHEIENVFLYKYTIEHASEIHVVDSGFYNFADKLNLKTDDIFLHQVRLKTYSSVFLNPVLNKQWIKIGY